MPEDKTKKSLKYSLYDGAAYAVMDGMTSTFLTPFAVALNASVSLIAALTYVPQLAGAFSQLIVTRLVDFLKDRKKIVVFSSFMHAVLWIPLLLIPYVSPNKKYMIIVYVSIQTIIVQIMQSVGNAWLGDLIPKYERGKFFGARNKIVGATSFAATIAAGVILNYFSPVNPFIGFSILFFVAFVSRSISGIFKARMYHPEPGIEHAEKFSLADFVKRVDKTNYGHFVIYITLFKFATYIASPFFALYMLRDLNFSYLQFTILAAAELIASFIAMGIWGRIIDEKGTKHVLYMTGMMAPLIPVLWLFSGNFYYLILVEFFSGLSWAGFNLSASNFIFDAVKPENRVRCIAYHKFFEGSAIFIGALLGGYLINTIPSWIFISSIPFVFLISGILRLATSLAILPTLKEARLIEVDIGHSFFKRFLSIRPSEGLVFEVLGEYHKVKEKIQEVHEYIKEKAKSKTDKKEADVYAKRLLKFIDKEIAPKKERHDITDMHEIEHITEEIEKGRKIK
ncbi:MFS transporter [Candidatus Woesearchaeota archaeon]|nr:MFS transporter [Candidatus Woesearchaeota archaeon]